MKKYLKYFFYFQVKLFIEINVGRSLHTQEFKEFRITRYGFNKNRLKKYPKEIFAIYKDKHKSLTIYNNSQESDIKNLARFRCLGLGDYDNIKIYGEKNGHIKTKRS